MKYAFFVSGTNTTYLSNTVNKYFGCNLKCLVNKYRVEYAKHLINDEKCAVNELTKMCGFASQSVFYAAFKKIIGLSPLQYRNVEPDRSSLDAK